MPPKRLSFCSDKCVDAWKIRSQPEYVRYKLFERDKGICAICGLDCLALVKELEKLDPSCHYRWQRRHWEYEQEVRDNKALLKRLDELCIPNHRYRGRRRYGIWDADHIKPVVEGGGECSLDNYRTLCCKCHKAETSKLRKRRSRNGSHLLQLPAGRSVLQQHVRHDPDVRSSRQLCLFEHYVHVHKRSTSFKIERPRRRRRAGTAKASKLPVDRTIDPIVSQVDLGSDSP